MCIVPTKRDAHKSVCLHRRKDKCKRDSLDGRQGIWLVSGRKARRIGHSFQYLCVLVRGVPTTRRCAEQFIDICYKFLAACVSPSLIGIAMCLLHVSEHTRLLLPPPFVLLACCLLPIHNDLPLFSGSPSFIFRVAQTDDKKGTQVVVLIMFLRTGFFLRSGSACGLRLKLSHLRAVRRTAVHQIIRRRSRTVHMKKPGSGYSPFLSRETSTIDDLLPRNDLLESAIALTISENRDARTELEFVRHFIAGNFLSLASPVGPWDPYDTKPQIFALDKYIALPVFTSLDYLRLFCKRFKFTVRDPSGMLWADGPGDAAREEKVCTDACRLPFPDTSERLWCDYRTRQHSDCTEADSLGPPTVLHELGAAIDCSSSASAVCGGSYDVQTSFLEASDLFGTMEPVSQGTCSVQHVSESGRMEESMITSKRSRKKVSKKRRVGRFVTGSRRVKARCGVAPSLNDESTSKDRYSDCKAHDLFWAKVRATAPFGITQAAPLPVFGPLVRPFFVGYFADTDTLLHNASIAPEKVDIILNPASPIEFVLGREATDRVLHRDQLLLLAYRRVERELRGEFHRFLSLFAPEVLWARSACVPCPVSGKANEVKYELVILIQSEDINQTFLRFRAAKNRCQLMGHADLDVLPWDTAAPHVREASTLFYERMNIACAVNNGLGGVLGIYEQRGPVQTVNVGISADSYYHDPRALYTESHAVFTEELKVSRSVPLQCGPDTSAGEPRR